MELNFLSITDHRSPITDHRSLIIDHRHLFVICPTYFSFHNIFSIRLRLQGSRHNPKIWSRSDEADKFVLATMNATQKLTELFCPQHKTKKRRSVRPWHHDAAIGEVERKAHTLDKTHLQLSARNPYGWAT